MRSIGLAAVAALQLLGSVSLAQPDKSLPMKPAKPAPLMLRSSPNSPEAVPQLRTVNNADDLEKRIYDRWSKQDATSRAEATNKKWENAGGIAIDISKEAFDGVKKKTSGVEIAGDVLLAVAPTVSAMAPPWGTLAGVGMGFLGGCLQLFAFHPPPDPSLPFKELYAKISDKLEQIHAELNSELHSMQVAIQGALERLQGTTTEILQYVETLVKDLHFQVQKMDEINAAWTHAHVDLLSSLQSKKRKTRKALLDSTMRAIEGYSQSFGHEVEPGGCFSEENIASYLAFIMNTTNNNHYLTALMYQKVLADRFGLFFIDVIASMSVTKSVNMLTKSRTAKFKQQLEAYNGTLHNLSLQDLVVKTDEELRACAANSTVLQQSGQLSDQGLLKDPVAANKAMEVLIHCGQVGLDFVRQHWEILKLKPATVQLGKGTSFVEKVAPSIPGASQWMRDILSVETGAAEQIHMSSCGYPRPGAEKNKRYHVWFPQRFKDCGYYVAMSRLLLADELGAPKVRVRLFPAGNVQFTANSGGHHLWLCAFPSTHPAGLTNYILVGWQLDYDNPSCEWYLFPDRMGGDTDLSFEIKGGLSFDMEGGLSISCPLAPAKWGNGDAYQECGHGWKFGEESDGKCQGGGAGQFRWRINRSGELTCTQQAEARMELNI